MRWSFEPEMVDVPAGRLAMGTPECPDVAIEGDVVETVACAFKAAFVLPFPQVFDVAMAEQGVVVDAHLRVEGE